MEAYVSFVNRVVREEEGQDLVEYALLVGQISLGCLTALGLMTDALNNLWGRVTTALNGAI